MVTLKAASFGDIASSSFLVWRLSLAGIITVVVGSSCINQSDSSIHWSSNKYGESDYKPSHVVKIPSDLNSLNGKIDFFDLLLVDCGNLERLELLAKHVKPFVNEATIILVNSQYSTGLEDTFSGFFPKSCVFGIICDADVRVVTAKGVNSYYHRGLNVTTVVGSTLDNNNSVSKALQESSLVNSKLNGFLEALKSSEVYPCYVIPKGVNPTLRSQSWKRITSFISLEVLLVVYGTLDLTNKLSLAIGMGALSDILAVGRADGVLGLPSDKDFNLQKSLYDTMVKEHNQKYPCSFIKTAANPQSTVSSKDKAKDISTCVHNFDKGYEDHIAISLKRVISLAERYGLKLSYIECIYSFFIQIEKIQKDKQYDWLKQESIKTNNQHWQPTPSTSRTNFSQEQPPFQQQQLPFYPVQNYPSQQMQQQQYQAPIDSRQQILLTGQPIYYSQNAIYSAPPRAQMAPINYNYNDKYVSTNLISIHPRFHDSSSGSSTPSVQSSSQVIHPMKSSIYRKTSTSTIQSGDSLTKSQQSMYEYANVNNILDDTTSRFGEVDTVEAMSTLGLEESKN
ncbi:hypothetical protein CANARDRAFT_69123 [[Candida] arabinofermentans NRRL YB-2248]|uniref:Ketopantoate reductase C-terminal domain-containing protein n=1 Tax=[Candida] arabinofermentans NRRL YB-2248 TaxID=983967 RepID=A0A1E4SXI7_9ASCO|nr:hypothetical protein CANARDRAFT_69123 [[Candida] arabinofermentans NRRL YB-2248]